MGRKLIRWFVVLLWLCVGSVGCDDSTNTHTPTPTPTPTPFPRCTDDGAFCFGENIRVNDRTEGDQRNPQIAIGPEGTVYVVWRDDQGRGDIFLARSNNHGDSFEPSIKISDAPGEDIEELEPAIAVDDLGTVYVVWVDFRSSQAGRIRIARSLDRGQSFQPSVAVEPSSRAAQYGPVTAAHGAGKVYVAWLDRRFGQKNVVFSRSNDHGLSFSSPIRMGDNTPGFSTQEDLDITVDDANTIYAVWADYRGTSEPNIYFAKSTNGGQSFQPNVRVDDTGDLFANQLGPGIAVSANGIVYVAWYDARNGVGSWRVYFTRSTDGGGSFEENKRISSHFSESFYTLGVISRSRDDVFVAWPGYSEEFSSDIYGRASFTSGVDFVDPLRINDGSEKRSQLSADMAIDGQGHIDVVWMDGREPDPWNIYFSKGKHKN